MRAVLLAVLLAALPLAGCAGSEDDTVDGGVDAGDEAGCGETNPIAVMDTNHGEIRIELYCDKAPQTVQNFGDLANDGFYDSVKFHRVIGPTKSPPDGFMIQGGDPNSKTANKASWGGGGPGYRILDEFYCKDGHITNTLPADCELGLKFTEAGQLAMANKGAPKTGGSQFFITLTATSHLNGKHTIFGEVASGMDVVREIGSVPTDTSDRPVEAVVIESITIEGELPGVTVQKFQGD
jgi:peptidyl-prolyl cis-trans isomerase A (cyclophilin A)